MDRKTELVVLICREIAGCSDLEPIDWDTVSLVIEVEEEAVSNKGFAYLADAGIKPFSVRSRQFYDYCRELPAVMQVVGEEPWKECLVQIRRADGEIKIDFNYDQAPRWAITPRTLVRMREELRPVFD